MKTRKFVSVTLFALMTSLSGTASSNLPLNIETVGKGMIDKQIVVYKSARNKAIMDTLASIDPNAAYSDIGGGDADACLNKDDDMVCKAIYGQITKNLERLLSVSLQASHNIRAFNPMAVPYSKELTVGLLKLMPMKK